MNTSSKAACAVFIMSATQLFSCPFTFVNDTSSKVVLIDSQQQAHFIDPRESRDIVGAIAGERIEIIEINSSTNRVENRYDLYELECAVRAEHTILSFADIKNQALKQGAEILPFSIGTQQFEVVSGMNA